MSVASDILDFAETPSIFKLDENLWAVVFSMMKLVIARFMLREAKRLGKLRNGARVFETTSGLMGLALAYACREMSHPLTLVTDPAVDEALRVRLELLGATVEIVDEWDPERGIQAARLARLEALRRGEPDSYWTEQYHNPLGPCAYEPVALRIARTLGRVDQLVTTVGTGCSGTGLIRALRRNGDAVRWIAVDTHNSVLFGQPNGSRLLRGLGNSIVPRNLDHSLVDEVHWVTFGEAARAAEEMHSILCLDVGPTSGAAYLVARWTAKQYPESRIVFVCPDSGERYRLTALNPAWRRAQHVDVVSLPVSPTRISQPWPCQLCWA